MMEIDRRMFGLQLQAVRRRAGYRTATALAEAVGYAGSTVKHYENAVTVPTIDRALEVSEAVFGEELALQGLMALMRASTVGSSEFGRFLEERA